MTAPAPAHFDLESVPVSLRAPLGGLLAEDKLKLPILSASISKLLATCNQDCPEMEDIVHLVSTDQGLAAHVLRLANSAAYAPINELVTIDDAVRRLGIRAIGDMAIGHMVLNGFAKRDTAEQKTLWRHAAVAGLYAYRIGSGIGLRGRASLMPGLLMDVGRPLAFGLIDEVEGLLGEPIEYDTRQYIAELLHTELGVRLVREWSLPPEVEAAVRFHDCYEEAEEFALEAKIANLAGVLTAWALDPEEIHNESLMELAIVRDLEVSERLLSQLMSSTEEILQTAKAFE
jgi:HD-like signal output (HDOD) protein